MEFGYFTLSDNHYANNPRSANDFVLEIRDQAVLADKLGYHSVWVGEHHFDSLGVNSRPDLLLASVAPLTKNVRLDKAVGAYHDASVKAGKKPGRAMCSYFIYIADNEKEENYGREAQMRYFRECALPAFTMKPEHAPPTMHYFLKIVNILENMKKEDLSDKSILLGSPQKIIDTLKTVEASGIEEVILYFNVGAKPNALVQEQMHKFMELIAPHFEGKHKLRRA